MREMVLEVGRRRAVALRRVAFALGAVLSAALLLLAPAAGASTALPGLLAERWLFFAEAQHAVAACCGRR
jgi:DMSO reductase anchor subunit